MTPVTHAQASDFRRLLLTRAENDRLGHELLTGIVQRRVIGLAIVANKRVSELVAQGLHTLVRRQAVVDDDPIGRRLVVTVRTTRDRRERDGAADLLGESDEARDDRGELVAFNVPDRWIEGRRHRRRRERRDLVVGFWDWAVLELLLQSGLRNEEARGGWCASGADTRSRSRAPRQSFGGCSQATAAA